MMKVKAEDQKACKIDKIVCRNFKEIMRYGIEIFRIAGHNAKFYEIEIEKVENQENKYR